MKKRIYAFDLIRAISTIAIVCFHFFVNNKQIIWWPQTANISLGEIAVALFFILSGASLMCAYSKKLYLKKYFWHRFKSIYPMFWLAYCITFLFNFYYWRGINNAIPLYKIIYSIIGFDGYMLYKGDNFYILGEWFLGCLILMYMLFPIIYLGVKKSPIVTWLGILMIYISVSLNYQSTMLFDRNILINLPLFVFGMVVSEHIVGESNIDNKFKKRSIKICISTICIIVVVSALWGGRIFPHNVLIVGIATFILLFIISKYFENHLMSSLVYTISKYSYAIFLVHHVVNSYIANHFQSNMLNHIELFLAFLIYLIITMTLSVLLYKMDSKLKQRIHAVFVKEGERRVER